MPGVVLAPESISWIAAVASLADRALDVTMIEKDQGQWFSDGDDRTAPIVHDGGPFTPDGVVHARSCDGPRSMVRP